MTASFMETRNPSTVNLHKKSNCFAVDLMKPNIASNIIAKGLLGSS